MLWVLAATLVSGMASLSSCHSDPYYAESLIPQDNSGNPADGQGSDGQDSSDPATDSLVQAHTLVTVLKNEGYTPEEFVAHLGAPSFSAMTAGISPQINAIAKSMAMSKLQTHLPTLDKMFADEVGIEGDGTRRWHIESYTFTYRSQSVDGQEQVLSGRVTFPNNKVSGTPHQVKSLSLHTHQALMGADWAPSENLMLMPLRTLWNSAVIEPDFQNYGVGHGVLPDGNGSPKGLSRQLTDCTLAALEVMRLHGVSLADDGYTTSWGSSQTAAVPLLFAKYYETEAPEWFRKAVRLHSTYVGEGPLDLSDAVPNYYCKHPEHFRFSYFYVAGYLSGFSAQQLGGYQAAELLAPWLSTTHVTVDGKDYTFLDAIAKALISASHPARPELKTLDQVISPDMVTPDGQLDQNSPKTQAFLACLKAAGNLDNWAPKLPIYIGHSPEDPALPHEYSYRVYQKLSNNGQNPQVHMLDVRNTGQLSAVLGDAASMHGLISILMLLNMSCVELPADMATVYTEE